LNGYSIEKNIENSITNEKKKFLVHIIFTSGINDEIELAYCTITPCICILCAEGFLINKKNCAVVKDKILRKE
jgi:hypothetical protein